MTNSLIIIIALIALNFCTTSQIKCQAQNPVEFSLKSYANDVNLEPYEIKEFPYIRDDCDKGLWPRIITHKNNDNTITVCWVSSNKIVISNFDSTYNITSMGQITPKLSYFGSFVKDNSTNTLYILSIKHNEENDTSSTICVTAYDKQLNELNSCFIKSNKETGLNAKKPGDFGTFDMALSNDELGVIMSAEQYKSADNLNHQKACFFVLNKNTLEINKSKYSKNIASHSFNQGLYYMDEHFLSLNLADGYPRGIYLSSDLVGRVIFTYKTKHKSEPKTINDKILEAAKWSNDTYTYTQMGNLINTNDGYYFIGAGEKSVNNNETSQAFNEPRNLFMLLINKNFTNSSPQKYQGTYSSEIVSPEVVISKGDTSPFFSFYGYNGELSIQKRVGIVWLTQYTDMIKENVLNPLAIKLDENKIAVFYELWVHKSGYKTTYCLITDNFGNIIKTPTNIGKIRFHRNTFPVLINGKIIWVTGVKNKKQLLVHSLDIK